MKHISQSSLGRISYKPRNTKSLVQLQLPLNSCSNNPVKKVYLRFLNPEVRQTVSRLRIELPSGFVSYSDGRTIARQSCRGEFSTT